MFYRALYTKNGVYRHKRWRKIEAETDEEARNKADEMAWQDKLLSLVRIDEPKKVIPEKVTVLYRTDD